MSLGAVEALAHSAIVTDENFFSHAKSVSTAPRPVCQASFPRRALERQLALAKKIIISAAKKLACHPPIPTIPIESGNLQVIIMNVTIAAKRVLFALLTVTGLALYALGQDQQAPCPLPVTYDTASTQSSSQSPEKPPCMRAVNHNGMVLCLPCPAYDAHIRHGDTDAGPCDKPGNETPPGH